jgi:tetratricopeptide (TPR) repeat protein
MATTTHHRRITRKELRQPDEFQNIIEKTTTFIGENLLRILAVVAAAIVLIFGLMGVRAYFARQRNLAAEAFYQATSALDRKDFRTAATAYAQLAQAYPATPLGQLARFYAGNAYLALGDNVRARDAYRQYLATADRPTFREMALMQLGVADENLGDTAGAQKAYEDAASLNGPEQERAALNAARLMAQRGDKQGAVAAYQRLLREHPFTQERAIVVDALADLGATPETPPANPTASIPVTVKK